MDPGQGSQAEEAEDGSSDRARAAGQGEGAGPLEVRLEGDLGRPCASPQRNGTTVRVLRPGRSSAGRGWARAAGRSGAELGAGRRPPSPRPSQVTDPAAPAPPRSIFRRPGPPRPRAACAAAPGASAGPDERGPGHPSSAPRRPPWPPRPPPAASCCSSRCSGSPWRRS